MKVFLCGGGSADQTIDAYKRLNEVIDHSKPCLYIPLAMEYEMYDSCYEWICGELKKINIRNTFKLLNDLKVSDTFDKIKRYIQQGGVIFGGSAGAIIYGKDLKACQLDDENSVNLLDTSGFNVISGYKETYK